MRKHFILLGYIISLFGEDKKIFNEKINRVNKYSDLIKKYEKKNLSLPQNKLFLKLDENNSVYVVYSHISKGKFLISTNEIVNAYYIADIIRGYFTVYLGCNDFSSEDLFYLLEINKKPKSNWNDNIFMKELTEKNEFILDEYDFYKQRINEGYQIYYERNFDSLKKFLKIVYKNNNLGESLKHLIESYKLFNGYMSGSYYEVHYKPYRENCSDELMKKKFLENRHSYELAFISAFKGIERFFNVNSFYKNQIEELFANIDFENFAKDDIYKRYHEIFSGHQKEITYEELLKHFLDYRNVTAAHGNKNPPKEFFITEDNIIEIQLFLRELIDRAIYE